MKAFIFVLSLCLFSSVSFSQSGGFFSKMQSPSIDSGIAGMFGQTGWFFRPVVSVASYSVPGGEVSAGAGAAYQLMAYDPASDSWSSIVSISGLIYYNQGLTGYKPYPIGIGSSIGLFNNHVLVGYKYDGRSQLEIGTAISFN